MTTKRNGGASSSILLKPTVLLCAALFLFGNVAQASNIRPVAATRAGAAAVATNRQRRQPQTKNKRDDPPIVRRRAETSSSSTAQVIAEPIKKKAIKLSPHAQVAVQVTATATSCLLTWALINHRQWPIARASSLVGLLACFVLRSPALAAASLSGAFAGMSSYLSSSLSSNSNDKGALVAAATLALVSGIVYAAESKWALHLLAGKGGRLGTVSVVSSLVYFALRRDVQSFCSAVWTDLVKCFGVGPLAATAVLLWARTTLGQERKWILEEEEEAESNVLLNLSFRINKKQMEITKKRQQRQRELQLLPFRLLTTSAKVTALALLLHRFAASALPSEKQLSVKSVSHALQTIAITFACSLIQQGTPGNVASLCILGLAATYLWQGRYTVPMCVGGLLGMTKWPSTNNNNAKKDDVKKNHNLVPLLQASALVTLLLHTGATGLKGLGGRLGVYCVWSVLVVSTPWW